jgi:hypothetical protein
MFHLKLECIGERSNREQRLYQAMVDSAAPEYVPFFEPENRVPWVARILGPDPKYGLRREFVKGDKWFGEASSNWNRGVYLHYDLGDGIYEVHELVSWTRSRRYFVCVAADKSTEMTKDEVLKWANEAGQK